MKRYITAVLAGLLLSLASPARADMETVVSFAADLPPGNMAIGPDGRMFMSVHAFFGPELRVVEVLADGSTRPYPNETWARAPQDGATGLFGVLGLNVDRQGILWMLDGSGPEHSGRLVGWDTQTESLHRILHIGQPAARANSFLNDLAVDRQHGAIYIADPAAGVNAALIVVELKTGQMRRVLEGSRFTVPEEVDLVIDGRKMMFGDMPARIGVNPITLDARGEWVYFAAMSGTSIYRVRSQDLRDASLSAMELEARVERYGTKPVSDGITMDTAGNIYVTAIGDNAIGAVRADGSYETLFQDDSISWPDGFAVGADGKIYVTINELHNSPPLNGGVYGAEGKFSIRRFDPLAPAVSGR